MENTQLNIADIASMKSLLEAACNRAAFRANEMTTVGNLYDKLTRFIEQYQAQQQSAQVPEQPQGDQNA